MAKVRTPGDTARGVYKGAANEDEVYSGAVKGLAAGLDKCWRVVVCTIKCLRN